MFLTPPFVLRRALQRGHSLGAIFLVVSTLLISSLASQAADKDLRGWLGWRGPLQNGVSLETNLPANWPGETKPTWTADIKGGGAPVIAGDRVFVFGYYGEGEDVQEALACFKAADGALIWERRFSDYNSDIIYERYGIGSPVVDAATGNVYLKTSPGTMYCFSWDGELVWERSMMEEFGQLTFPNGRTGAPVIFEDLVIIHGITANWGTNGPAADRFYAFDKTTGELVWYSTPGIRPVDSSYATPVFGKLGNRIVFYAGTGCGNIVCVDARTGQPYWRWQMSSGGVNSSIVLYGDDKLIAIHGKENLDSSQIGRMVCLQIPTEVPSGEPVVLGKDAEVWRNDEDLRHFTSSPVLVGNRIYQIVATGELKALDADSGKLLWKLKLAPDQLHASPLYADGKLYVPMFDGEFYTIKPTDEGGEILAKVKVDGNCIGSPALWNGHLYLHSKEKLYCWAAPQAKTPEDWGRPADEVFLESIGEKDKKAENAVALRVIPAEFALKPGETINFRVESLDASGRFVEDVTGKVAWETFIPPTAKVKAKVDATMNKKGQLVAGAEAKESAGAFKATFGELSATVRGRLVTPQSYTQDFNDFELTATADDGETFSFPPLPWLGARMRWRVIESDLGGEGKPDKILTNTLDRVLFQRSKNFFGSPEQSNYTLSADVMTDGNRRIKSDVGLINQRYVIALMGNWQQIEVSSNHDRLKRHVPFQWKPKTWYRLVTRVDVNEDGSGTVRAKAWERGTEEPEAWTIEVPVKHAHTKGAPGIYALSPQSKKRVFIDNITLEPNK